MQQEVSILFTVFFKIMIKKEKFRQKDNLFAKLLFSYMTLQTLEGMEKNILNVGNETGSILTVL